MFNIFNDLWELLRSVLLYVSSDPAGLAIERLLATEMLLYVIMRELVQYSRFEPVVDVVHHIVNLDKALHLWLVVVWSFLSLYHLLEDQSTLRWVLILENAQGVIVVVSGRKAVFDTLEVELMWHDWVVETAGRAVGLAVSWTSCHALCTQQGVRKSYGILAIKVVNRSAFVFTFKRIECWNWVLIFLHERVIVVPCAPQVLLLDWCLKERAAALVAGECRCFRRLEHILLDIESHTSLLYDQLLYLSAQCCLLGLMRFHLLYGLGKVLLQLFHSLILVLLNMTKGGSRVLLLIGRCRNIVPNAII